MPNPAGDLARPLARRRLLTSSVAATVVLVLSLLAWAAPPAYNWDMLAYAAISLDEGDSVIRHERLWRYVERDAPAAAIDTLRAKNAEDFPGPRAADVVRYRRVTAQNPEAFAQQLPFYAVKPMYPAIIAAGTAAFNSVASALGYPADLGPVTASIVAAKFSWVCLGVALFLLLRLRLSNALALCACLLAMSLPMVHALSRYSTPDTLSALLILFGFVLALRDPSRRWTIAAAGVVLLGVAARPDNILLLGLLLTWFLWNSRIRFRWAVAVGMAGVLWCLTLSELSHNYGWSVLVYHSFVDYSEYPAKLEPQLTWPFLVDIYLSKLGDSIAFFQYLIFGCLVAGFRFLQRGIADRLLQALLVMLIFMAEHWLLFPDQKDRLMVAPYLFILTSALFCAVDEWAYRRRAGAVNSHEPIISKSS